MWLGRHDGLDQRDGGGTDLAGFPLRRMDAGSHDETSMRARHYAATRKGIAPGLVLAMLAPLAPKHNMYPSIAMPYARLADLSDPLFEMGLSGATTFVMVGGGVHLEHAIRRIDTSHSKHAFRTGHHLNRRARQPWPIPRVNFPPINAAVLAGLAAC